MAVTIVATPGAANANSYATVAEGTTYWGNRPNESAWSGAASDDVRGRALIQATQRIDEEEFQGYPVNPLNGTSEETTQALKFPRYEIENGDGGYYLSTVIPQPIKDATLELARAILAGDFAVADTGLEGFDEIVLGSLKVKPRHAQRGGELPEVVKRKLRPFLLGPSASFQVRVERS